MSLTYFQCTISITIWRSLSSSYDLKTDRSYENEDLNLEPKHMDDNVACVVGAK